MAMNKREREELDHYRKRVAVLKEEIRNLLNSPAGDGSIVASAIGTNEEYNLPENARVAFKMGERNVIVIQREDGGMLKIAQHGLGVGGLKVRPWRTNVILVGVND